MDLPRTPEDLRAPVAQPGDPLDDTLLKHGADLTEEEVRSLLGRKPHLDPVHPLHPATVGRILQANQTDTRPQAPTPLTDGAGGDHGEAMKRFASDFAAAASRDGVEPTVKALQTALNARAADWPADDPQRPTPIMPDGLYVQNTTARAPFDKAGEENCQNRPHPEPLEG